MAISPTRSFNPDFGEMIEEAFERCGLELKTGNDVRTARRSINYLTLEWANKGINLWTLDEVTVGPLVAGVSDIDVDIDTISILDVAIRRNTGNASSQLDITLNRVSSTSYSQYPNKLTQGFPSNFWYQRTAIRDVSDGVNRTGTITLYPVPDNSTDYTLVYWRMKRMADAGGNIGLTAEIPDRFLPAFTAGLAFHVAMKKAKGQVPLLKASYNELLEEAMAEDRVKEDMMIHPDMSPYSGNC